MKRSVKPLDFYFLLKILLVLVGLFVIVLLTRSAVAFTDDQKEGVCDVLNLSIFECVDFWEGYDFWSNFTGCDCQNETIYVNQTVYVNQTEYIQNNCTDELAWKQAEFDHEYRLAELEVGGSSSGDSYSKSEIDLKISELLTNRNPPAQNYAQTSSSDRSFDSSFWIFILLAVGVLGFFIYKKFKGHFPRPSHEVSSSVGDDLLPYTKPVEIKGGKEGGTENVSSGSF